MKTSSLRIQATKEARALLVPWLSCAAVAVGGTVYHFSGLAVGLGCLTLCAMAIGQEYSYGTLSTLLTQPVARERVLFVKLGVLLPMLLGLLLIWAAAALVLETDKSLVVAVESGRSIAAALMVISVGFSLTPWLTMASRSTLGGVVFTCATPVALSVVAMLVQFTPGLSPIHVFSMDALRGLGWQLNVRAGLFALCAIGLAGATRAFSRMEVTEGRALELRRPRRRAVSSTRPYVHSNLVNLVKKEMHLLGGAFLTSGLLVVVWGIDLIARRLVPSYPGVVDGLAAGFFSYAIAILCGALSGAEDRKLGTLNAQLLQPVAARKQWAVKVATLFVVVCTLALLLPMILVLLDSKSDLATGLIDLSRRVSTVASPAHLIRSLFGVAVMLSTAFAALTFGSLYISSWCSSVMRAVLIAVPLIFVVPQIVAGIADALGLRLSLALLRHLPIDRRAAYADMLIHWARPVNFILVICASMAGWFLYFGLANYRFSERSARLFWRHAAPIIATLLVLLTLMSIAGHLEQYAPFLNRP